MKLEVGMYVRIKNKAGYCAIGKIENINDFREPSMKYCIDIQSDDFVFVPKDMITKASYNVIDLIEVGDYVNGYEVEYKFEYSLRFQSGQDYWYMKNEDIKSIVTKEQFESMIYKVE